MLAYYHYTTSRTDQKALGGEQSFYRIGPPGIEPGLYAPEAHVLPVYYGPLFFEHRSVPHIWLHNSVYSQNIYSH